jgi:hypothetical protein
MADFSDKHDKRYQKRSSHKFLSAAPMPVV